ncbi:MAG: ATP-binding cassette domain-containing protein [Calditrichaceae bacterium]|nr:ATP-binding cassette domain-containing protein [Calditrichia bacterium]NUQ42187.1 ATP-binding cassette domain-containing protein [Calditrichaceae bacterium]
MHVKAENLYKEFDGKAAVVDLSFEARAGMVMGILGPPEAGKTTALRMILNVLDPDSGSVFYDDRPVSAAVRNAMGYLPELRGLYQKYSLNDVLVYFARLKNVSSKKARVEAVRLMDRFGLIENMESPLASLSQEMQEKVQILIAVIHNPDLLVLDEPFSGFEAKNYRLIRQVIDHFRSEGKTIILASRELSEAETICDEVILLDRGGTILQDNLKRIYKRFHENLIVVEAADNLQALRTIPGVKKLVQEKQVARLYVDEQVSTQKVLDAIIRAVNVSRIEVNRPNLNDIYLQIAPTGMKESS